MYICIFVFTVFSPRFSFGIIEQGHAVVEVVMKVKHCNKRFVMFIVAAT